jgi:hypothetical protein
MINQSNWWSYTQLEVWNSDSTLYNNTCNTVAYDDSYLESDTSTAGKIYLWFKAPPGNYTIKIKWRVILGATGPRGRSQATIYDVAAHTNIMNHFILTSGSPWDSGTQEYDINVTTTDDAWHVVLYYMPTLNFPNESPAHGSTGSAEGHLNVREVRQR